MDVTHKMTSGYKGAVNTVFICNSAQFTTEMCCKGGRGEGRGEGRGWKKRSEQGEKKKEKGSGNIVRVSICRGKKIRGGGAK
jgi:hypothetical protein